MQEPVGAWGEPAGAVATDLIGMVYDLLGNDLDGAVDGIEDPRLV